METVPLNSEFLTSVCLLLFFFLSYEIKSFLSKMHNASEREQAILAHYVNLIGVLNDFALN